MILNYKAFRTRCPKVSHETFLKIEGYVNLIVKWNRKINLVSKLLIESNKIEDHIFDSLGLIDYIDPKAHLVVDIGSGAGLPGIILAIMGYNMVLIEVNLKKTAFLKEVIYRLNLSAKVIEKDVGDVNDIKTNIIISKALSTVTNVMNWTSKIRSNPCRYLLLKNHNQKKEVEELKNTTSFRLNILQNKYNTEGIIIEADINSQ